MDIDTTATTTEQLPTIIIQRTNERSLRFRGALLGKNGSSFNNSSPDYSGSTGRRTTLYLYSTSGGNYVAVRENETQWQGDHDTTEAKLCKTVDEVVDFLGCGRVAQYLYDITDINYCFDVE